MKNLKSLNIYVFNMLNMVYEDLAGEYIINYHNFDSIMGLAAVTAAYLVIRHKEDIADIINKIRS